MRRRKPRQARGRGRTTFLAVQPARELHSLAQVGGGLLGVPGDGRAVLGVVGAGEGLEGVEVAVDVVGDLGCPGRSAWWCRAGFWRCFSGVCFCAFLLGYLIRNFFRYFRADGRGPEANRVFFFQFECDSSERRRVNDLCE